MCPPPLPGRGLDGTARGKGRATGGPVSRVTVAPMRVHPIATLACLGLVTFPASGLAADGVETERAAIERAQRIGTGLLWGGVATAGAGGLTLLGIIPSHRNLRLARAERSLCLLSAPECPDQDAEIQRWARARTSVAVAGSILVGAGLTLVGVGVWKRRTARRQLDALDQRARPEWSIRPSFGPVSAGVTLVARF